MAFQEVRRMARKRRSFGGAFKAKVALAACRGEKTTAQLASEYGVHAGQVTAWKKQFLEGAAGLLEEVYLRDYTDGWQAEASLAAYFRLYDEERIHQSLGYRTPAEVYRDRGSSGGQPPD